MKNIVLVGFSGVGKTTVGRLLSSKLKMEFFDTDENAAAGAFEEKGRQIF